MRHHSLAQMKYKAGIKFVGNGDVYLGRSLDFTDVHICQNLENGHLRFVYFIVTYFQGKYCIKHIVEI